MEQEQNVFSGTKKVIKRDGRKDEYTVGRIREACRKAFKEVYHDEEEFNEKIGLIITEVNKMVQSREEKEINIEDIQDYVVAALDKYDKEVGKAYQEYREERSFERESRSNLVKEFDDIISNTSEENKANGNVDGSKIQAIRAIMSNLVGKKYSRWKYIPKDLRKKQEKEIYQHDEMYYGLPFYNCCNANWHDMFKNGFVLGTTEIEPPKSLSTAVNVLTQLASHVSSNTYGGTTFSRIITGLTPYAKMSLEKHKKIAETFVKPELKDKYAWDMLEKETKDCMQSVEYEIQTLMTSRSEVPFLTLEIDCVDMDAPEEDQKIQVMLTKAILNQRLKGLTNGVTPVFPKLVFELKRGNNLELDDKYVELFKLAAKTSAFRQYPDYTMYDRVCEVTGDYKPPMGK